MFKFAVCVTYAVIAHAGSVALERRTSAIAALQEPNFVPRWYARPRLPFTMHALKTVLLLIFQEGKPAKRPHSAPAGPGHYFAGHLAGFQ
jgi:hypothetical protein